MKLQIRRHLVQLAATVLYNINGAAVPLNGKGVNFDINTACVPGLNCQYCRYSIAGCPLGVAQLAAAGKLSNIAATFYGLLLLFALLFGRMICGWGCPMGLLQDLLDKRLRHQRGEWRQKGWGVACGNRAGSKTGRRVPGKETENCSTVWQSA